MGSGLDFSLNTKNNILLVIQNDKIFKYLDLFELIY